MHIASGTCAFNLFLVLDNLVTSGNKNVWPEMRCKLVLHVDVPGDSDLLHQHLQQVPRPQLRGGGSRTRPGGDQGELKSKVVI